MTKIVACIIARTTSTRLSHKVLRNVTEENTLLDVLIKRIQKSTLIDEIYIATSNEKVDDILEDYAIKHGIKIYRGSPENVISRMNEIGKIENATQLIRITGDNVFTDTKLLDYQIQHHLKHELEYSRFENVPIGATAEVISTNVLLDCESRINPNESEYMMLYLFNPDLYKVGVIKYRTQNSVSDYTLTVDTPEDLIRTKEILSLTKNIYCDLDEILEVIMLHNVRNAKYASTGIVKLPEKKTMTFKEFRNDMEERIAKSQVVNYQKNSYFLYAETAFHHEGNLEELYRLIDLANEGGFEGIKFQVLFELNDYMVSTHKDFESVQKLLFSEQEWQNVIEYTKNLNMKVIFMPLDIKSMEWVLKNQNLIDYIDIHSVSFYDQELKSLIKQSAIPIILGIGGREQIEIEQSVDYFGNQLKVLMHGFQSFPTNLLKARILRIKLLSELYPDIIIGYADHSPYYTDDAVESLVYSYLLGARMFEKHITLNEGVEKIDYSAAIGIEKIKKIKERLVLVNTIMDDDTPFLLNDDEKVYRERQKKLVALRNIKKGELITKENTKLKIIQDEGEVGFNKIPCQNIRATMNIESNEPITTLNSHEIR